MLLRPAYRPLLAHTHSIGSFKMPLKARILQPATANLRQNSTLVEIPKPLPEDEPDDVLFNSIYGLRTIELNRPKKLNSLDGSMCRKIIPHLKEWEKSDMINAVIMKGAGEKSLCAGGDVATLAKWNQEGPEGRQRSKDYFALEYRLDHLIATYTKPYIAFMDGITMGGGVGLSVHAPFRIATERTLFAMPETTIGFFPEVGASFFLPRMDGCLGTYLGLTSERLKGVQAYYHGVATHYLHSSSLPDLEARLAELTIPDYAEMTERLTIINNTIIEFATGVPHDEPPQLAGHIRAAIDRCFAAETVEGILENLKLESEPLSEEQDAKDKKAGIVRQPEWAKKTLKAISGRSPTSLKVTRKQMILGKEWNIAEAFKREHDIAANFMEHPDFVSGVTARLITKSSDPVSWQPPSLEDVTSKATDAFFANPTAGTPSYRLLDETPSRQYSQYPHNWIGLPSEEKIECFIKDSNLSPSEIVDHFHRSTSGKPGIKQVIEDFLKRRTVTDGDGHARLGKVYDITGNSL